MDAGQDLLRTPGAATHKEKRPERRNPEKGNTEMIKVEKDPEQDLGRFIDTESFWVIWQVGHTPRGDKRIRRISQQYHTEARAEADAERYRRSGVVTWVEEARPLAPSQVPQAAVDALIKDGTYARLYRTQYTSERAAA